MEVWSPDDLKSHLDKGEKVFLKLWKKGAVFVSYQIQRLTD